MWIRLYRELKLIYTARHINCTHKLTHKLLFFFFKLQTCSPGEKLDEVLLQDILTCHSIFGT